MPATAPETDTLPEDPQTVRELEAAVHALAAEVGDTSEAIDDLTAFAEANRKIGKSAGLGEAEPHINNAIRLSGVLAARLTGGLRNAGDVADKAIGDAHRRTVQERILETLISISPVIAQTIFSRGGAAAQGHGVGVCPECASSATTRDIIARAAAASVDAASESGMTYDAVVEAVRKVTGFTADEVIAAHAKYGNPSVRAATDANPTSSPDAGTHDAGTPDDVLLGNAFGHPIGT
jgi:hypothetical protein